jgi:hemin uptake protein HemP
LCLVAPAAARGRLAFAYSIELRLSALQGATPVDRGDRQPSAAGPRFVPSDYEIRLQVERVNLINHERIRLQCKYECLSFALNMGSHLSNRKQASVAYDATPSAEGLGGPIELSSEMLLSGRREIFIRHGAERYRLRLTRMNKLILTK